MTITALNEIGGDGDNTTNVSKATSSNVTANNLLVIWGTKATGATDAFVAGDCTKNAGTATLSTITLDRTVEQADGSGGFENVGIWSAIITGSGSITMNVGGAAAGSFMNIALGEYPSNGWDGTRAEATSVSSTATDSVSPGQTGNGTTAAGGLYAAGLSISAGGTITETPTAAFTQVYEQEGGAAHNVCNMARQIVTAASTTQCSWTLTGTTLGWGAALVIYKETAGGAAPANRIMFPAQTSAMGVGSIFFGNRMACAGI